MQIISNIEGSCFYYSTPSIKRQSRDCS